MSARHYRATIEQLGHHTWSVTGAFADLIVERPNDASPTHPWKVRRVRETTGAIFTDFQIALGDAYSKATGFNRT